MTCMTCKFWHQRTEKSGTCRRHAPKPSMFPAQATQVGVALVWPETQTTETCGEHELREAAALGHGVE